MESFSARAVRLYRESPCVFLDCDGVIFDSNGFKLDALRHALYGYPPAAVAEMELFWSANGGVSRYTKLEHFFRQILNTDDVVARVHAAAARFGEYARRAYDPALPVAEALHLARDAGSGRCFVVSGADQDELRDVFSSKGLTGLFAQICGSPVSKLDHVRRILNERGCAPDEAIFIGDGAGDYDVCRSLGVPFLYLDQYSEWVHARATLNGALNALAFDTWSELLTFLEVTPGENGVPGATLPPEP